MVAPVEQDDVDGLSAEEPTGGEATETAADHHDPVPRRGFLMSCAW